MHWYSWEGVTESKEQGGLGITNPMAHAQALCAKFLCSMSKGDQIWTLMLKDMINKGKVVSKGVKLKGVSWLEILFAPD